MALRCPINTGFDHRRIRFSLRFLMAAVVFFGAAAALFSQLVLVPYRYEMRAVNMIRALGGKFSVEVDGPAWLRWIVGDDYFQVVRIIVLSGPGITDDRLAVLANLRGLTSLRIVEAPITEEGVRQLQGLQRLTHLTLACPSITTDAIRFVPAVSTQLEHLDLTGTQLDDEGLSYLQQLPRLRVLTLARTQITDAGLPKLCSLSGLESLCLDSCDITDEAVAHLSGFRHLHRLSVNDTRMTAIGVSRLELQLPCRVQSHYTRSADDQIVIPLITEPLEFRLQPTPRSNRSDLELQIISIE